jgi:hypothetical protein
MARSKVTLETCDNPQCGYEQMIDTSGEPAQGYHFTKGFWVLGGGGPIPAFYACSKACIVRALDRVMDGGRS